MVQYVKNSPLVPSVHGQAAHTSGDAVCLAQTPPHSAQKLDHPTTPEATGTIVLLCLQSNPGGTQLVTNRSASQLTVLCCSALVRTDTRGVPGLAVYTWRKPAFFEDRKYC